MPVTFVRGDPTLTRAHMLAFGHNRRGRIELGSLESHLMNTNPAAFSAYRRRCRQGRVRAGTYWVWREARLPLVFLVVRDSSVGATRLRYVQSVCIQLARDYALEGINSLAIAPLGLPGEWDEIQAVLKTWFRLSNLPVMVYDRYLPGVQAEETL